MTLHRTWRVIRGVSLLDAEVKIITQFPGSFLVEFKKDHGRYKKGERIILGKQCLKPCKTDFEI